jgi:uncharacterized RDD family membrane protein YckC
MALPWRKTRTQPRRPSPQNRRQREILTAEGLTLPLTLASRGARAAAVLIDLGLIFTAVLIITLLLGWLETAIGQGKAAQAAFQTVLVIWIIAVFLCRVAWFTAFELGPRGATPGKRALGIRIAARPGADGAATRLSTEAVIARNLLRDIELFMPAVFIGGAVMGGQDTALAAWSSLIWVAIFALFPLFNRDALRCGDLIAGTWVVEAPRRRLDQALSLGEAAQGTSALTGASYRFSPADLAVYGEYELQMLERVLRDNRADAMADVAERICAKIGWSAGQGDERAFLEAYYTQLRARLETGMRLGRRKADRFSQ